MQLSFVIKRPASTGLKVLIAVTLGAASLVSAPAGPFVDPAGQRAILRLKSPPRKVVVATVLGGYNIYSQPLEQRLDKMDGYLDEAAQRATMVASSRHLDLVVLPEFFLARPGPDLTSKVVSLEEVWPRVSSAAKLHHCYLVVPLLLRESVNPQRRSNAALLVDREGNQVGIYRKVHPVAPQNSPVLEDGTMPGGEFPVFQCDFGRLGIQICFDLHYADGWQALADQGAEIVALPSASPETVHPMFYALQHEYYIVSATPRDHAAIYNPMGLIEAEAVREGEVLVHEIDLSFALLHWDAALEEGGALRRKFGAKVGFHYYRAEDGGIFWSNDPQIPIGEMLRSLGLSEYHAELARIRALQDRTRGGRPSIP